ncbi:hypothetical protein QWY77_06110 [Thalassotalea ponticola]|uniref:hypothetical protein n=1 Tax=Thalassotalea ponticola TaxID=1523392 RepID=UPI0025B3FC57|nr:hypothetical protein [Thalassotalea ponticola]MDN3652334.1 hypothetical protein [Thalassotalea ponticola]
MKFHLITNCTNSKSSKAKKKIKFSDSIGKQCVESHWLDSIYADSPSIKAIDLYVGDHWSNVKRLSEVCSEISVVSAGYGLISSEQLIHSYDATFSSNTENSVGQIYDSKLLADRNRLWWNAIHRHNHYDVGPIYSLYKSVEPSIFVFALSPSYLKVVEPELVALRKENIATPDNTLIISSDAKIDDSLEKMFYRNSEDFCTELGGSRVSLNIRLAKFFIERLNNNSAFSTQAASIYKEIQKRAKPATKFNRKKLTDEDVILFIRDEIKVAGKAKFSASTLLKKLRDKGLACEQKRFGSLYKQVVNSK